MRKFIYFLQDSPKRPNEINAISKAEVRSLLMENISDESQILAIYTEAEFNEKFLGKKHVDAENDDEYNEKYSNSNDFFDKMMQAANNLSNQQAQSDIQQPIQQVVQEMPAQITKVPNDIIKDSSNDELTNKVTYFEDDGISFKLENGKLYRKRWRNINDSPEKYEYRILRAKTGKECEKDLFNVEILDWVEFQQK
jgi:hypothetical protein